MTRKEAAGGEDHESLDNNPSRCICPVILKSV